ncbi:MAG: hypothetical protein UY26_C0003G0174 [Candidatus Jorgensenbacteria bacterium GW2011_GWA1_48_13]|uniref:Uncharacterized protein n=2 Tax=Candidatus Joergenseniibacteriota TaxID=1752739 RepID=A0A0G1W986_9BACT|nr:MAG: hypothetical protein UY26_C0003G0174 [Candidatus Jorgensenbacteria bacterium GW2011_GWA1_48_13]KKU98873.1 MAG: hypothetical protein UY32_C0012G0002 [Candidatus Jorgensenbacteria bacterium GW2011_GWC1_48_8]KKW15130.1 MAG: hypothetical protein UY55_C0002G0188 [Candidatus Jorgensenbacteria bacterium GW2011_GWB1_50_10]
MRKIKAHLIVSGLATGGLILAALNFTSQSLFSDLDQFVLVAESDIHIAQNTQVSSGDIIVNGRLRISENDVINGNIFSDEIRIAEETQINGNATFNKLHLADNSGILGTTSTPVSLPIIKLPSIPNFSAGAENVTVEGEETLGPGDFNIIEVKDGARLTLNPGIYNLNELKLKDGSKLFFSATTVINIRQTLDIKNRVFAVSSTNLDPTALTVNVVSESKVADKSKGKRELKDAQPVTIGEDSFISARLLAPSAKVVFGNRATFIGQAIAKEIQVGEGAVLGRENAFEKESDPEKVVEDQGVKFIVNEIVVLFGEGAAAGDLLTVADLVQGQATGFLPDLGIGKIEVTTQTVDELNSLIDLIKSSNNPLIEEVIPNALIL